MPGRFSYFGFVDPSGGGQDSYCLAIAHLEGEAVVLDCLREVKPPLDPAVTTGELAAVARSYGLSTVTGDRYGGQWPAEVWRAHGITYQFSEKSKSDLYGEFLPLINAAKVELLDNPRLVNQLCAPRAPHDARQRSSAIDHPGGPNYHDDVANVCAGVCATATRTPDGMTTGTYGYRRPRDGAGRGMAQRAAAATWALAHANPAAGGAACPLGCGASRRPVPAQQERRRSSRHVLEPRR